MSSTNLNSYFKLKKAKAIKIKVLILISLISLFSIIFLFNKLFSFNLSPSNVNALGKSIGTFNISNIPIEDDIFTVCIDAGHGDWDVGAIGLNGYYEKDIVLSIALLVGELLEMEGINVVYTRTTDTLTWADNATENLYERVNFSKNNNSDLFISIHCNSTDDSSNYNGVETWYNIKDKESETLATLIQDELSSLEYTTDRGIKFYPDDEPLAVLDHNNVPSTLIELGFLSNWSDEAFLTSNYGQSLIAQGITNAILNYFDL